MIIEIRPCQKALGYQSQRWPKTRHHIVRIGGREVRAIIGNDESVGVLAIAAMIAASFLT